MEQTANGYCVDCQKPDTCQDCFPRKAHHTDHTDEPEFLLVDPLDHPEEAINGLISGIENLDKGKISDGYHTFDELYEHRCVLYLQMCKLLASFVSRHHKVWRSLLHADGSSYDGWFVLGVNTDAGSQITYHLPLRMWTKCNFAATLDNAPEWDGHTSDDVLKRLLNL